VYNGSNYDNLIIEYIAAKEFNYPDSMKIIVMLSDGKPCGNTGVVDTQEIVYRLRKKGYIIFSVSLVSDVIEENNVIYGKTWNIDASCGNIDHKLRELFIKMATEYK
jgi:nitric oxide reductase activation protein